MGLNTGNKQIGEYGKFTEFIERHDFFVLTTHDPADADGLGAEMVLGCVLREKGKKFCIINSSPVPKQFRFMDPLGIIEPWDDGKHGFLPEQSAVLMVDTADMHNIGQMRDAVCRAKEVFIVDHHEAITASFFPGICDSSAASASELSVELAEAAGVTIDSQAAFAAYIGIAYDTGFFAYPKTGPRTFRIALTLLDLGVKPNDVYRYLHESSTNAALLLQQRALGSLTLHCDGRLAVQMLHFHDFTETGADSEETNGFVNFPLRSRDIIVSLLIKEKQEGKIRCSLRSKEGTVDVAKIAHDFGGGGHTNASGFKSNLSIEQTLGLALAKITEELDRA